MVELVNVTYTIQGKPILKNVSLSVGEQETLAILGASGSGKSTILRVIMGLLQPESGQVLVQGKHLETLEYHESMAVRKQMGIVFQDGALFDSLTVGENVGYYLMEHNHQSHHEVEPLVLEMLRTVGLAHTMDMTPQELSGGMRRRVAIARALIYKPSLILYDEPTTGLDPVSRDSILELINRLKTEHKVASVIVTHDMEDAARVADRFIMIRDGEVVWHGNRREFVAQQKKIHDYFRVTESLQERA